MNQVTIEEKSTTYSVKLPYHSDLMAQNYDANIVAIEESDSRITVLPYDGSEWRGYFKFSHSDPDRVIAVCQMMAAAAQMVKNHNEQKTLDTSGNA